SASNPEQKMTDLSEDSSMEEYKKTMASVLQVIRMVSERVDGNNGAARGFLESRLDCLEATMHDAKKAHDQLVDSLDCLSALPGRVEDLHTQQVSLAAGKEALESDRASFEKVREQLQVDQASLDEGRQQLETDRASCKEVQDQLQSAQGSFEGERKQLQIDQASLEKGRGQLESDQASVHQAREQLARDQESLDAERKQLQSDRESLEKGRGQLDSDQASVQQAQEQLKRDRACLDKEREQLQNERASFDKMREQLQADQRSLGQEREELQRGQANLEKLREKLERDQASFSTTLEAFREKEDMVALAKTSAQNAQVKNKEDRERIEAEKATMREVSVVTEAICEKIQTLTMGQEKLVTTTSSLAEQRVEVEALAHINSAMEVRVTGLQADVGRWKALVAEEQHDHSQTLADLEASMEECEQADRENVVSSIKLETTINDLTKRLGDEKRKRHTTECLVNSLLEEQRPRRGRVMDVAVQAETVLTVEPAVQVEHVTARQGISDLESLGTKRPWDGFSGPSQVRSDGTAGEDHDTFLPRKRVRMSAMDESPWQVLVNDMTGFLLQLKPEIRNSSMELGEVYEEITAFCYTRECQSYLRRFLYGNSGQWYCFLQLIKYGPEYPGSLFLRVRSAKNMISIQLDAFKFTKGTKLVKQFPPLGTISFANRALKKAIITYFSKFKI
ncbi:hypothetical protein SLS62_010430, partial [Diatrype stigma]